MPILNTQQGRELTDVLIADIVLQLLSYMAETERGFIRQRQAEGMVFQTIAGALLLDTYKKIPIQRQQAVPVLLW